MKGTLIDACGVVGSGLVVAGATLIYLPAGLIVAGILMVAAAVIGGRRMEAS